MTLYKDGDLAVFLQLSAFETYTYSNQTSLGLRCLLYTLRLKLSSFNSKST
jgi:hypothetical protein